MKVLRFYITYISADAVAEMESNQVKKELVNQSEYVFNSGQNRHHGIYGLGLYFKKLSFDFLDPAKKYDITIYTNAPDGIKVNTEQKKEITNKEKLSFPLIQSGGFAVKAVER